MREHIFALLYTFRESYEFFRLFQGGPFTRSANTCTWFHSFSVKNSEFLSAYHRITFPSNPLSSVKDRLALAIIEDAEASGELKPGQTVIEASESSVS